MVIAQIDELTIGLIVAGASLFGAAVVRLLGYLLRGRDKQAENTTTAIRDQLGQMQEALDTTKTEMNDSRERDMRELRDHHAKNQSAVGHLRETMATVSQKQSTDFRALRRHSERLDKNQEEIKDNADRINETAVAIQGVGTKLDALKTAIERNGT